MKLLEQTTLLKKNLQNPMDTLKSFRKIWTLLKETLTRDLILKYTIEKILNVWCISKINNFKCQHFHFKISIDCTCYMINWIKANSKSSNFQGIIFLPASCYFLYTMPVFRGENCIIVCIKCWPYNKSASVKKMTEVKYLLLKISRKWAYRTEKVFI